MTALDESSRSDSRVENRPRERPLSGKADIQNLASPESVLNGRFTLESGRWAVRLVAGRY